MRQVNVTGHSPGSTVGTCGAVMARGRGEAPAENGASSAVLHAGAHAVSADGSRVFFEAVPGSDCSGPTHLYMRVNGGSEDAETVDLGAYVFVAGNAQDTELLLEKQAGENRGLYLYHTETATAEFLSGTGLAVNAGMKISEDFNVIYMEIGNSVDRYDIPSRTLFPLQITVPLSSSQQAVDYVSPDGRYAYLGGGGGTRYDSAENVIECIECASSFDPNPKQVIENRGGHGLALSGTTFRTLDGVPARVYDSADGDFAFFATDAALLPEDVNGEPEEVGLPSVHTSEFPYTDVYEWRADGIDGCAHLQGCLALITPGTDGQMVALFGTDASGRDVFFTTRSQLLPSDDDTAGDIYDARIDGGFPEQTRPVECEGDACSTPASPPNDATPSSLTFSGAGNVVQSPPLEQGVKRKASKKKYKPRKKIKRRKGRKAAKRLGKVKKSTARRSK